MERGTRRISQTSIKGFTLIEVMIVISIIAAIVVMAFPKLTTKSTQVKSVVRKIAILSREIRASARLNNATYRMVINLGDETQKSRVQSIWVEKAQGEVLNNYDPEDPPKLPVPGEEEDEDEEEKTAPQFTVDPKILKNPEVLPEALIIEDVELANVEDPITTGLLYIHYLPGGFADEATIHIKLDEKVKWTVAIEPLTARVDIIDRYVKLKDLRSGK